MSYVIGIDLGTGSLKGILVNKKGEIISDASSHYETKILNKGYSEQDPTNWISAMETVISSLISQTPDAAELTEGISFSGQMHSLVLLDKNGKPVRDAILWNDVRTTEQCKRIEAEVDVVDITKNKALEGFTLPKILWVQENEPQIWNQAEKFMLPKDYLIHYLTGESVMDYSDASGTLMLDIETQKWSQSILDQFKISLEMAPTLVHSDDEVGKISEELCQKLGFINAPRVFAGAADNAAAALASGISKESRGLLSIGTSGVFLVPEGDVVKDYRGEIHFFNQATRHSFYSMGVTLSAGKSLDWFKETFAPKVSFEDLLKDISTIPQGSNGLMFTPYIMGERTPYTDSKIRGSFIGIDASHTLIDFTRSVVEGITYSIRDSFEIMKKNGKFIDEIISVGGGSKNSDWLQMQADIFGVTITTLKQEEGPALGSAILASSGCGWFNSIEDCIAEFVKFDEQYIPNTNNVVKYDSLYQIYREIYPATKRITHELS